MYNTTPLKSKEIRFTVRTPKRGIPFVPGLGRNTHFSDKRKPCRSTSKRAWRDDTL